MASALLVWTASGVLLAGSVGAQDARIKRSAKRRFEPVMAFARAAAPWAGYAYARGGFVDASGKVRGEGLSPASYVSVVLHRMRDGEPWRRHYSLEVQQWHGDRIAAYFGLAPRRIVSTRDLTDPARTQRLLARDVLRAGGLYLFEARAGRRGHLGFVRVRPNGDLEQAHYAAKRRWNGLATGDFRAWLRAAPTYCKEPLKLYACPELLAPAKADSTRHDVPAPGELNSYVLEVLASYPADGTHRYWWPRGKDGRGWSGNTRDLRYGGKVLFRGDPQGRAYCCGLTFEVFVRAWRLWCKRTNRPWTIHGLDASGVRRLQKQWFGSSKDKTCIRTALVANGLGTRITDWKQARAGDFVQLWRANGSGHSVVFLDWVRKDDRVIGLEYWSTQKSTKGIGRRKEYFLASKGKRRLLREKLYLCRVGVAN